MDFTQSALYLDVQKVWRKAREPLGVNVEVNIHISPTEIIKPLRFISRDVDQNFVLNYGDVVFITVLMSQSDYAYKIYPNRSLLYITLKDSPTSALDGELINSAYSTSEKYKAIMLEENGNPVLEHTGRNTPDIQQLDANGFVEVTFQLLSEVLYQLRMVSVGRTFHRVTGDRLLRTIFSSAFDSLTVDDAIKPYGIDITTINNERVYDQIAIPQSTKLIELADFLQNKAGGLYNAGLGSYYLRRHWRIFPIYNTDRQDDVEESITIINVPESVMPSVEKTYMREGKHSTILATGSITFNDDSEQQQLNNGNAVRFANADNFMENRTTISNNRVSYKRNKNASEVVTAQRGDNLNLAPFSDITANAFVEYSKMARRDGGIITLNWEYANAALIKPGMVVKIMYLDGSTIRILYGTLLGAQHYTHTRDTVRPEARYRTNIALAIFINRKKAYL